ncbi:(deoxy)nucleoside triphosphate pyrophosphohydrolase [Pseudoramibacter sp.]|jgi:8-oxo-dGTP diphosphatase|uniref:(deoxy)nucleoside triphosphate pyrophosphohydrolase n=1 Tax=Pseudoramibacter sp. TaxID=2034862 RepID=UPI0025E9A5C1|nr:(deoxy)nucleoside triphosphate pyrophosphohydrolase [Pseudoramibacter sp.]MCH4071839.1 (deoxy)nucleoside triphosphate pyrophosphohydrolase [Pseudoramibacter sp.]MCH4105608.1 (deoxy)nucleoside triphosphate pyrophosphohydrolase [Pseudoramibacter sp.]
MTSSQNKTIDVVAAVIRKDNKIFATQRGYGEFKDGWEFPGGKVEPGETREQALVREIEEELNTEITVGDLIAVIEQDYPGFHLTMACYWAEVKQGSLDLLEHEAAKWLDREHLGTVNWLPADRQLVDGWLLTQKKINGE